MAKNITLLGASYSNVPAVELPQTGGGTAKFTDTSPTTATDSDVASGKIYFKADGTQSTGTGSGGGGGGVVIVDTTDVHGGTIRSITATDQFSARTATDVTLSGATVTIPDGYYPDQVTKTVSTTTHSSPTVSVNSSTGLITATHVQTEGYVSADTSTGTSQLTTKAAATIAPSTSNQTIASGTYLTGAQTIAAVTTTNLTAANIVSGVTVKVGYSGDDDCVASITGTASGGDSKNTQTAQSTSRATTSTYTSVISLTCSKTGTYDVYWSCMRSSTGGTNGSQLYIAGSAYGSADTTFTNHVQTKHLTNVSITKDQTVAVYARSRGSNYYAYVPQLTIVEA